MRAAQQAAVIMNAAVRRARARAAARYNAHAVFPDEVNARLTEQLDYLKIQPARVLDLGCATGRGVHALQERYPQAHIVGCEVIFDWLRQSEGANRVCAQPDQLPFAGGSFDLVVCNLGAYWCAMQPLLPELARVAARGGLLLISSFGPDTLQELHRAFAQVDTYQHVLDFADMHDVGDALAQAGFVEPIAQMERLALTYESLPQLHADLRALGMQNFSPARMRGLYPKGAWQRFCERYRAGADGVLAATFEVVYASAWKPQQPARLPDGRQVIDFPKWRK